MEIEEVRKEVLQQIISLLHLNSLFDLRFCYRYKRDCQEQGLLNCAFPGKIKVDDLDSSGRQATVDAIKKGSKDVLVNMEAFACKQFMDERKIRQIAYLSVDAPSYNPWEGKEWVYTIRLGFRITPIKYWPQKAAAMA